MAIHSGKLVDVRVSTGYVTPRFQMPGPHSGGLIYTFGDGTGEEFSLLADFEIAVSSLHTNQADALIFITNNAVLEADMAVVATELIMKCADLELTITQSSSPNDGLSTNAALSPVLEFLGKGLKFPFTFQKRSGGAQISTATSSDHAHIHESIRQILGTRKGERFMRPDFGSRLHELVFEPNDRLLYGLIRHEVIEALDQWEPRIIITDVNIQADSTNEHLVLVETKYRLISSQVEGNFVWPFYRELE